MSQQHSMLSCLNVSLSSPPQSWGAEGYHLWVVPSIPERKKRRRRSQEQQQQQQDAEEEKEKEEEEQELNEEMADPPPPRSTPRVGILQFHFIKSALTVNPCTVRDRPVFHFPHRHTQTGLHMLAATKTYQCCD